MSALHCDPNCRPVKCCECTLHSGHVNPDDKSTDRQTDMATQIKTASVVFHATVSPGTHFHSAKLVMYGSKSVPYFKLKWINRNAFLFLE